MGDLTDLFRLFVVVHWIIRLHELSRRLRPLFFQGFGCTFKLAKRSEIWKSGPLVWTKQWQCESTLKAVWFVNRGENLY